MNPNTDGRSMEQIVNLGHSVGIWNQCNERTCNTDSEGESSSEKPPSLPRGAGPSSIVPLTGGQGSPMHPNSGKHAEGILMGTLPAFPSNLSEDGDTADKCKVSHASRTDGSPNAEMLNLTSRNIKSDLFMEMESEIKLKTLLCDIGPSKKFESAADENGLLPLNGERVSSAINEETLPNGMDQMNHFQFKSIQSYQRKDKGKALSDAPVLQRVSKEEDGTRGSIESAGSSVVGKAQRSFERPLTVNGERARKEEENDPPSTSFVRHGNTFMNWISNVLKGSSKFDQDGSSAVAVSLPYHVVEKQKQELIMCMENKDSECKMGFRTIFQSLYCPSVSSQDARSLNVQYQVEEVSKDLLLANTICNTQRIPNASHVRIDRYGFPQKEFNQFKSADGIGPLTHAMKSSTTLAVVQENAHTHWGYRFNRKIDSAPEKRGAGSSSYSLGKRKIDSTEKVDVDSALEERAICNIGYKSFQPEGLWLSRFSSKKCNPTLNIDHCSHGIGGFDVGKESKCDTESSSCLKRLKRHGDDKLIHKKTPNLHSSSFNISEAIASVLGRRLDALKHIMPSNETNDSHRTAGVCFFCGRRGHDLQECSKVTNSELEDLVRNLHADNWGEELPGFCIKCFHFDHWAITCPNASLRGHQLEFGDSVADNCCPSKAQLLFSDRVLSASDYGKRIAPSSGKTACNYVDRQISEVPTLTYFDAIKKLRLSRTEILKWKNAHASRLPIDGFFLRLRVGKWEEGPGGAIYCVACITKTGLQRNSLTWSEGEDAIVATVGGSTQCSVEIQCISNHGFLEGELMAWWRTALREDLPIPGEEVLRLKLEVKLKLGF